MEESISDGHHALDLMSLNTAGPVGVAVREREAHRSAASGAAGGFTYAEFYRLLAAVPPSSSSSSTSTSTDAPEDNGIDNDAAAAVVEAIAEAVAAARAEPPAAEPGFSEGGGEAGEDREGGTAAVLAAVAPAPSSSVKASTPVYSADTAGAGTDSINSKEGGVFVTAADGVDAEAGREEGSSAVTVTRAKGVGLPAAGDGVAVTATAGCGQDGEEGQLTGLAGTERGVQGLVSGVEAGR